MLRTESDTLTLGDYICSSLAIAIAIAIAMLANHAQALLSGVSSLYLQCRKSPQQAGPTQPPGVAVFCCLLLGV